MRLLEPLTIGGRTSRNRIMFGPHVTNLGDDDRSLTDRHVAYYERRARGGCGIVVIEGASVHDSDWPYERAPLAERCASGWRSIAEACHAHGSLVVASLDHAGGQGSSAYSQRELWAPSRVPEVNSREVPKWMESDDIDAVVDGFARAAAAAVASGCDGVEVNAGQHSLVRQFASGLTNHRGDEYGTDRLLFARRVLTAVREAIDRTAPGAILGLRLSCDELAPWAGITPEMAPAIAADLVACGVDHLVVVRGSIFSVEKTRPDFHEPTGFNVETCRSVRAAVGADIAVFLQGSVVDPGHAEWAIGDGVCDAVEMTRGQIADADLAVKIAEGAAVRPCIRCNQTCQVRDARNPIVSCVVDPSSGHETTDPDWYAPARDARRVLVVGAGPAGLETARVAARRGHRVTIVERSTRIGGTAAIAGPGRAFVEWQAAECAALGVEMRVATESIVDLARDADVVVQATGSRPGTASYEVGPGATVIDVADVRRGLVTLPVEGDVAILDPIGGPIAVALAEEIGARAVLITPDNIAGNELSRTGDLAPANVRLARAGVRVERRATVRAVTSSPNGPVVRVQDRFSGEIREVAVAAVVDAGFREPDEPIADAALRVGDCVAPRTVLEAVLEGRRAALSI